MTELSFFLTDWDDGKIEGGRDPLGLQKVWTILARRGIQGINSVSGDLMGWRTLLAGAGLAHELGASPVETILAFERLAAYAKFADYRSNLQTTHWEGIRGKSALDKMHSVTWSEIYVSKTEAQHHDVLTLLSYQKGTGVYGQISGAAQHLGVLDSSRNLTSAGLELWGILKKEGELEKYTPALRKCLLEGKAIEASLQEIVLKLSGRCFTSESEKKWYEENIVKGQLLRRSSAVPQAWSPAHQQELYEVTQKHHPQFFATPSFNFNLFFNLISKGAYTTGFKSWIHNIKSIEHILGTADKVFLWILTECRAPCTLDELVERAKKELVIPTFTEGNDLVQLAYQQIIETAYPKDQKNTAPIFDLLKSLPQEQDHTTYLSSLIELNKLISDARGKLTWLRKEKEAYTCWSCYVLSSTHQLSTATDLGYHSYYLNTFCRLAHEVHTGVLR